MPGQLGSDGEVPPPNTESKLEPKFGLPVPTRIFTKGNEGNEGGPEAAASARHYIDAPMVMIACAMRGLKTASERYVIADGHK